ncbi:helix-turn-helix domain-containing protein [Nonomuraea sp. NPDC004297]
MGAKDLQRLARYVVRRRTSLGFKYREDFATVTGLSVRTLGDIERARRTVSDATVAVVEEALGWKPGSFDAILHQGEPEIMESAPPSPEPEPAEHNRTDDLDYLLGEDQDLHAIWRGLQAISELTEQERVHALTLIKALRGVASDQRKADAGTITR